MLYPSFVCGRRRVRPRGTTTPRRRLLHHIRRRMSYGRQPHAAGRDRGRRGVRRAPRAPPPRPPLHHAGDKLEHALEGVAALGLMIAERNALLDVRDESRLDNHTAVRRPLNRCVWRVQKGLEKRRTVRCPLPGLGDAARDGSLIIRRCEPRPITAGRPAAREPRRVAGAGDVKARVLYAGICGTDLHEVYDGRCSFRSSARIPDPCAGAGHPRARALR
jgi:hypothetical protein